jgi:hypothetical protein
MALTVKELENAKPREKDYKLYDEHGLLVVVTPRGGQWFRFKYTFNGKQNWISLGVFPEVTLKKAREARDAMRELLSQGKDLSQDRKATKLAQVLEVGQTFEIVARESLGKRGYSADNLRRELGRFEKYVFPKIGSFPIAQIKPPHLLAIVQPIDELGKQDTAHKVLQTCGMVFR